MTRRSVQVRRDEVGVVLDVAVEGDGPDTLVLVPSALRGAEDFVELAQALGQQGLRSISVNPRGAGRSEGPVQGLTLHDMADDIAAIIAGPGGGVAHVVGHGLGNTFVRCLAADYPDMVASAMLLAAGPNHRFIPGPRPGVSNRLTLMSDPKVPTSERLGAIGSFFAVGNDPMVWIDGWWPPSAPLVEALYATEPDEWWTAGRTAPVLVIQGLEDRPPSSPEAGRDLVAEIGPERARLIELERCGHAMLPEQPTLLGKAIIDFVRQHAGRGQRP